MTGPRRDKPKAGHAAGAAVLGPHWLTLSDAAVRFDASRDQLRRMVRAGRMPNAVQDTDSPRQTWRVPVGDLLAAGLRVRTHTEPPDRPGGIAAGASFDFLDRLTALEHEVAALRALSASRRSHARDLRRILAARQPATSRVAGRPGSTSRRNP